MKFSQICSRCGMFLFMMDVITMLPKIPSNLPKSLDEFNYPTSASTAGVDEGVIMLLYFGPALNNPTFEKPTSSDHLLVT